MIRWIGAIIGFLIFRMSFFGALLGYLVGWGIENINSKNVANHSNAHFSQQQALSTFLQSFLMLAAHVIQADGRIMHSEMELVRNYLRQSFGEGVVQTANQMLLNNFNLRKQYGDSVWMQELRKACTQMRISMPEEHRLQMIAFLAGIAKADGNVDSSELDAIREIARMIGVQESVVDQMFSLGGQSLDDAYRVLGVSPDATDAEVKAAFRRLTLQYHPDRVATLGDDVRRSAEQRFKEINEAKERVYAARGM